MTHEAAMRAAIAEAERARGSTGDNPWVGSVIVVGGAVVAVGRTQGPGEDHAEIGALHEARERGVDLTTATLYSTLEPCSFHGRTPACAAVIVASGIRHVVTGIRDPNPRVDGAGIAIVRAAGIDVVEDVCAEEIRQQLGPWMARYHPHALEAYARALRPRPVAEIARALANRYALDAAIADEVTRRALA